MKNKIDFGKIAATSVGRMGGLAVATQLNRIPFVQKIQKPALKGALMFAVGSLVVPMIADKTGMNKKGSIGDVLGGVGDAISVYGLGVLGNSIAPNIFPTISGYEDAVYGYEDQPYNMGLITDEDGMSGTDDDDNMSGTDDDDTVGDIED